MEVGTLVYKSVGSALARVEQVEGDQSLIEYRYTVGSCKAGEQEWVPTASLVPSRATRRYTAAHTRDEFGEDRWMIEDSETGDWVGDDAPYGSRDLAEDAARRMNANLLLGHEEN